jgi:hypothetical protein
MPGVRIGRANENEHDSTHAEEHRPLPNPLRRNCVRKIYELLCAMLDSVGLLAISFAAGIEASQLYHAPWLDAIRRTTLGGLALGYGFLWSDLACYAVGVGLGAIIEYGASFAAQRRR